jgi:hypothetical protein
MIFSYRVFITCTSYRLLPGMESTPFLMFRIALVSERESRSSVKVGPKKWRVRHGGSEVFHVAAGPLRWIHA